MSELARRILRKSVGAMRRESPQCAACRRTPVPGEFVHRIAAEGSERLVCSLCLADVPAAERDLATAERVHAGESHIQVAPRAA